MPLNVQPPVKLGIHTQNPVSLTDRDSVGQVQLGIQRLLKVIVYDRALWFTGEGAPPDPDVIGAKNGDCYLNTLTGDVYQLGV